MLLFGGITALLYVLSAFTPMTFATLLLAVVVLTASFLFVSSAQNGLTSVIGQQHAMTGQVSAMWNVFLSIPTVGALLLGGTLSGLLEEKDPDQALRILFLVGAAIMARDRALCTLEAFGRVRQYPRRERHGPSSDRGYEAAGAALADLSGDADLAAVEFRAGLDHAAAVSSSEHPARHRCPMGRVERHLRRLLHSDLHRVWTALPKVSPEDAAVVGNGLRRSADGSAALHPHGDAGPDRGRCPSA